MNGIENGTLSPSGHLRGGGEIAQPRTAHSRPLPLRSRVFSGQRVESNITCSATRFGSSLFWMCAPSAPMSPLAGAGHSDLKRGGNRGRGSRSCRRCKRRGHDCSHHGCGCVRRRRAQLPRKWWDTRRRGVRPRDQSGCGAAFDRAPPLRGKAGTDRSCAWKSYPERGFVRWMRLTMVAISSSGSAGLATWA